MENQESAQQEPTIQLPSLAQLLEDYDERIKSGDIVWKNENGVAVATMKTYHSLKKNTENKNPIVIRFSELQLFKLKKSSTDRSGDLRIQALTLMEQADAIDKDYADSYGTIEKDIEKTLKEKEGK